MLGRESGLRGVSGRAIGLRGGDIHDAEEDPLQGDLHESQHIPNT